MGKLYNLARMTTATTGTGTITLASAVPGFLSFSGAGVPDGQTVTYAIRDGNNSEIGRGVYTSSGTTLTRSVLKSTNSNNPINLSGSAEVVITAAAEDFSFQSGWTGSTTRTFQEKHKDIIAARDFGAVGDGVTDDTTALQAAIDHVVTNGGELRLGAGKFRITGSTGLVIDESAMTSDDENTRISIVGVGAGSTQIVHNGTASAITYVGGSTGSGPLAYLRLEAFRIDGTTGTGQHGVTIDNAAFFEMEDMVIYECDNAVRMTDVHSFQLVTSVVAYNKYGVTASYVNLSRPNNVTFEECEFRLNTTAAALVTGGGLVRFRGGSVEGNGTNGVSGAGGIFMIDSGVESNVGLVCEDVYFENNYGDCDVSFDENSSAVTHILRGCTFQQFQSPHVTNSIKLACSSGVAVKVAVNECTFGNVGGYTGTLTAFSTGGAAGTAWSVDISPDTTFDSYITKPTASARITYGLRAPSVTNHGVALFTGTDGLTASTGAGTAGQVLTSAGSSADPTFSPTTQAFCNNAGTVSIASGSTRYFGVGADSVNTSEFYVYFPIPKSGRINNLYVYTDGAPGSGQTYTFTLRTALADTSVVATISGAGSNSASDTTHSATVAAGDRVSIKVVTSASAATISSMTYSFLFESP